MDGLPHMLLNIRLISTSTCPYSPSTDTKAEQITLILLKSTTSINAVDGIGCVHSNLKFCFLFHYK